MWAGPGEGISALPRWSPSPAPVPAFVRGRGVARAFPRPKAALFPSSRKAEEGASWRTGLAREGATASAHTQGGGLTSLPWTPVFSGPLRCRVRLHRSQRDGEDGGALSALPSSGLPDCLFASGGWCGKMLDKSLITVCSVSYHCCYCNMFCFGAFSGSVGRGHCHPTGRRETLYNTKSHLSARATDAGPLSSRAERPAHTPVWQMTMAQ